MKKTIVPCLILAICLGLTACAVKSPPPPPTPSASQGHAPAETETVFAQEPEDLPEESCAPEAAAEAATEPGYEVLEAIYERYYPGTAGSSLSAAKYAAMLLDWYVAIKAEDTTARISAVQNTGESFASSHDLSPVAKTESGISINFPEKLSAIWSSAVSLAFGDTMVLDDAGYESLCLWNASDAEDLFTALYDGLGIERTGFITVYYPDDQVMYLKHTDIPSYMDDASGILYALQTAKVLPRDVELLSCETGDDGVIRLDLNSVFRDYLCRMGTSGETLTIAAIVDTFLSATGTQSLQLTVEGKILETGHAIYDSPLAFEDSFSD